MSHRTSVGLDVHARSIAAAALDHLTGEVVRLRPVGGGRMGPLARGAGEVRLRERPTGFGLQRPLAAAGVECRVGAVSKMPRPSGDRVKTDGRDAAFLARMPAVGSVAEAAVPTPEMEAARDPVRAREDCREGLMRARHLLSKLLPRKGVAYGGKTDRAKARREGEGPRPRAGRAGALPHPRHLHRHGLLHSRRGRRLRALPGCQAVHALTSASCPRSPRAARRSRALLDSGQLRPEESECVSQHAYVRLAIVRLNGHAPRACAAGRAI